MGRRLNYSEKEVRGILDAYLELSSKRTRPYIQVRLMDISVAMKSIPLPLREAAFYAGVAQFTLREASEILNVSHTRIAERYRYAVDEIVNFLNGGTYTPSL